MGRMSGRGSGLFKRDHARAIDRHIEYFGAGVRYHLRVEPRQSRLAPGSVEARKSIVVIVGPFAIWRREPALAGAR